MYLNIKQSVLKIKIGFCSWWTSSHTFFTGLNQCVTANAIYYYIFYKQDNYILFGILYSIIELTLQLYYACATVFKITHHVKIYMSETLRLEI